MRALGPRLADSARHAQRREHRVRFDNANVRSPPARTSAGGRAGSRPSRAGGVQLDLLLSCLSREGAWCRPGGRYGVPARRVRLSRTRARSPTRRRTWPPNRRVHEQCRRRDSNPRPSVGRTQVGQAVLDGGRVGARAFQWPPLRLARLRCERGSVDVVYPPGRIGALVIDPRRHGLSILLGRCAPSHHPPRTIDRLRSLLRSTTSRTEAQAGAPPQPRHSPAARDPDRRRVLAAAWGAVSARPAGRPRSHDDDVDVASAGRLELEAIRAEGASRRWFDAPHDGPVEAFAAEADRHPLFRLGWPQARRWRRGRARRRRPPRATMGPAGPRPSRDLARCAALGRPSAHPCSPPPPAGRASRVATRCLAEMAGRMM